MIYKFDILFKKILADGGVKVVTYSTLLKNPKAFGENENLAGAVGTLSLVKDGPEKGFSLNSLLLKYNSLLLDKLGAAASEEGFRLEFSFCDPEDVMSIEAGVLGEKGDVQPLEGQCQSVDKCCQIEELNLCSNLLVFLSDSCLKSEQSSDALYIVNSGEAAYIINSSFDFSAFDIVDKPFVYSVRFVQ